MLMPASTAAEIRTIVFNNIPIAYTLERKRVRNLNLRIRSDSTVHVSANAWQTPDDIDLFVMSKGAYILDAQQKFRKIAAARPEPHRYVSGEVFFIEGSAFTLDVQKGIHYAVTMKGTTLCVTVKDPADTEKIRRMTAHLYDTIAENLFAEISDRIYPLFSQYRFEKPAIRIRTMTSRWGTCLTSKATIVLNRQLAQVPRRCTEYVVLHEYCHFVHPNHSKRFYALVARFMPDWKERKKLLESSAKTMV
jgi:predicted metal-dependent hydrolase